jgi:hypothetical protein
MAEDFAARLPESTFSGADIQGFLLLKKWDLEGALATMNHWAKNKLAAKGKQKPEDTAEDCTSSPGSSPPPRSPPHRAFAMVPSSPNSPTSQAPPPIKLPTPLSSHQVSLPIKLSPSPGSPAHRAPAKLLSSPSSPTHQAFHPSRHQCLCYSLPRRKRCH